MNSKLLSKILLVVGVVLLAVTTLLYLMPEDHAQFDTEDDLAEQPMVAEEVELEPRVEIQDYISFILLAMAVGFITSGIAVYYVDNGIYIQVSKQLEKLSDDEKTVYNYIKDKHSVYQSKIVKEFNWSKVKVCRIINNLESKQLVAKEQTGMTNIVFLK